MAGRKVKPRRLFERNAELTFALMRYLLANLKAAKRLPQQFEIVILPDDDPELMAYNIGLLQKYGSEGKPVVFVRMASTRAMDFEKARPQVYAPLPV